MAWKARTGAVLHMLTVGGAIADDLVGWAPISTIAVDERRNRVFVINRFDPADHGNGSMSVLDATTVALLRTITVGRHPLALAVDEATARLFVVNTNTGCRPTASLWDRVPAAVRRVLSFLPAPARRTCHRPGTVTVINTPRR